MAGTCAHAYVDHSDDEYARGDVYTQTNEGVWSNMKAGLDGCTTPWRAKSGCSPR